LPEAYLQRLRQATHARLPRDRVAVARHADDLRPAPGQPALPRMGGRGMARTPLPECRDDCPEATGNDRRRARRFGVPARVRLTRTASAPPQPPCPSGVGW
jgi:hypothetical protein